MAGGHRKTAGRKAKTRGLLLGLSLAAVAASLVVGIVYQFFLRRLAHTTERTPPPLLLPTAGSAPGPDTSFRNEQGESGAIDLSNIRDGYILARCEAGRTAYLQIEKDGKRINEFLPANNEWHTYPLTMDDGAYTATICLRRSGNLYDKQVAVAFEAAMPDPMTKFLLPNYLVDYGEDSAVVALAHQLYAEAATDEELVQNTLLWMQDNLQYNDAPIMDENDQLTVEYYLPDLERVLREKHGICSDYAALFAAIMRINGIPCQMIYGDLRFETGGVKYHAWNLLWVEDEQGGAWRGYDPTKTDGSALRGPHVTGPIGQNEQSAYGAPRQIH